METSIKASDGHTLSAYIAGSEDASKGIVIVQEIFGVNSHIRELADFFATQGYRAVCPALFDRVQPGIELGYAPEDVQSGLAYRSKTTDEQALLDVEAAAGVLTQQASIGVVGYCWGGTIAWLAACRSNKFTAASCWYGGGIEKAKDETPKIPVQMHFGESDKSIPMHDVQAIRAAQPKVEIYTYEAAGHGFGCDQRGSYNATAADVARKRTLAFFGEHGA